MKSLFVVTTIDQAAQFRWIGGHKVSHKARSTGAAIVVIAVIVIGVAPESARGLPSSASHSVTLASETNYSSAVERPVWTFSCNSTNKTWKFSIGEVQVIDSAGKPWGYDGRRSGPWSITVFASAKGGPVPFSRSETLAQNDTDGLFGVAASSSSSNASKWCKTGATVSVVGFSGRSEPLLLEGVLN